MGELVRERDLLDRPDRAVSRHDVDLLRALDRSSRPPATREGSRTRFSSDVPGGRRPIAMSVACDEAISAGGFSARNCASSRTRTCASSRIVGTRRCFAGSPRRAITSSSICPKRAAGSTDAAELGLDAGVPGAGRRRGRDRSATARRPTGSRSASPPARSTRRRPRGGPARPARRWLDGPARRRAAGPSLGAGSGRGMAGIVARALRGSGFFIVWRLGDSPRLRTLRIKELRNKTLRAVRSFLPPSDRERQLGRRSRSSFSGRSRPRRQNRRRSRVDRAGATSGERRVA